MYGAITGHFPKNEFEKHVSNIMDIMSKKSLEAQHGALMALTYMMERNLMLQQEENKEALCNWATYNDIVKTICMYLYIKCQIIYQIFDTFFITFITY